MAKSKSPKIAEGEPFLASHVHVDRDGETKTLPAGHFVSEIDEKLTKEETAELEARNVLRPATPADVAHATARQTADATNGLQREHFQKRRELGAKQDKELREFDAEAKSQRAELSAQHDQEREALEADLAAEVAEQTEETPAVDPAAGNGGASTGEQA